MDQGVFRARLYGDSLALPRPDYVKSSERYISSLSSWWMRHEGVRSVDLCDRAKGSSTVADLYQWYKHDNGYYGESGDVLLIHCGIVDCAPRPVPRWIRRRIPKLPAALRRWTIKFLHDHRARILKLTGGWQQLNAQDFRLFYGRWLKEAVDNFSRIYILNIAPTNQATELRSPGFTDCILEYNAIIAEVVSSLDRDNVFLINVYELVSKDPASIDKFIVSEDGHHLTALSHQLLTEAIIKHEATHFDIQVADRKTGEARH
jgi:hypothetical protein